jgi:glycolate oxidase FAD binding subunit
MENSTDNRPRFAIDGREPQQVTFPESIEQVAEALHSATAQKTTVTPVGEGGFLHIGALPRRYDHALSLQKLNRVVDYQPTDMTVTVEAGMSLARLQALLGENRQWLPLDPPCPERVTIGGLIAANLSGPSRFSQGTVRDFLLGLRIVTADGTVIKGGGRVVKNVAGYDVPKLYCGSFGTLGVIVEATFKVRPYPERQLLCTCEFPSAEAAMDKVLTLLSTELQPFFIELTNFNPLPHNESTTNTNHLFIALAGLDEEVTYQGTRLRELLGEHAGTLQELPAGQDLTVANTLRDFPLAGEALLRCKASVLPSEIAGFYAKAEEEAGLRGLSLQLMSHAGSGIIYVRVPHNADVTPEKILSFVDWLRILAKQLGGSLVIEQIDPALKDRVDVWGHVGNSFPLMKRLKETLDPQGILNPGRFVGGI